MEAAAAKLQAEAEAKARKQLDEAEAAARKHAEALAAISAKGAKEAARGSSIRWEQEGWRLGSALNKDFQVLDQYWCRHTSPHEASAARRRRSASLAG